MNGQDNSKKFRTLRPRDFVLVASTLLVIALVYLALSRRSGSANAQSRAIDPTVAAHGQQLYMRSCAVCHGQSGQGMPRQGVDLRDSKMIATDGDAELVEFLRVGRLPDDPRSVTGLYMPPRGGNMTLKDEHLSAIVAYLRTVQRRQHQNEQ
ncbi:MAG: cytochrome c [Gemmatimonadaceae bacterium]|nr:cytochrome c [Gemmatimonadaceae bacterium]